jgi:hypothetical protein
LITLSPGRYRLKVSGRIAASAGGGQLQWVVHCHAAALILLRLPVLALGEQGKEIEAAFNVPQQGCSGQSLRLVGEPGDLSSPLEAEFSKIEISNAR